MRKLSQLLAASLTLVSTFAMAQDFKLGNLEIHNPIMHPTPARAPVAGGFMTIRNTGSKDDRLTGGAATFAGKVEVHQMKMDGDVMRMRAVEQGLVIPAGGEVVLKSGGYHVMFMKLGEQIKAGETYKATLTFEKSGTLEVEFDVMMRGHKKKMKNMNHSSHGLKKKVADE